MKNEAGFSDQNLTIPFDPDAPAPWLHQLTDYLNPPGVAYFVGAKDGPVKIGYTRRRIERRLAELKTAFGDPELEVLATRTGGDHRENAYHCQFAEHRLEGEWFTRCPEIEAEISRLNGGVA